jgi:hypothetical protein
MSNKKHKKNKKYPKSETAIAVQRTLCQEHPDHKEENNLKPSEPKREPSGFVAAGVFISLLALCATSYQAYIMRQTMQVDQRAWVGVLSVEGVVTDKGDSELRPGELLFPERTFHLRNTGKTPARRVGINYITIFQPASLPIPKYVEEKNQPSITIPNNIGPNSIFSREIKPGEGGEVIAPSAEFPSHLKGKFAFPAFSTTPGERNVIYVLAEITYFDIFDKQRTTMVCTMFIGTGGFLWCPVGNSMD